MKEKKLQSQIVLNFKQAYPEVQDMLIEINNDTNSRNHAMTRLAMGMVPGASDLIFIYKGVLTCFEIKNKETPHKTSHIQRQLNFGRQIQNQGFLYFMINDAESFDWVIKHIFEGNYKTLKLRSALNIADIQNRIANRKTITFHETIL